MAKDLVTPQKLAEAILRMVVNQKTDKEIGQALGLTQKAVAQRLTVMRKAGVKVPTRSVGRPRGSSLDVVALNKIVQ